MLHIQPRNKTEMLGEEVNFLSGKTGPVLEEVMQLGTQAARIDWDAG